MPGADDAARGNLAGIAPPGFTIVSALGSGGFATVYRAWQQTLEREVALKVFNIRLTDERQAVRFRSECTAVGRLDGHPHVVLVHEAQVPRTAYPYISMRLYRGGDLATRVASGPLTLQQVLEHGVLLASALTHAHRHGVIHRDLKPQNVLLGDDGLPVLADFGVAVVMGQTGAESRSQAFSLAHVSPEVLDGGTADERSDLYGLASTLYTAAAGKQPFPGSAVGPLAAAIMTSAPPPLDGEAAVLNDVVLATLAKDPADRPSSAAELGAALQALQARLGIAVTTAPAVGHGTADGRGPSPPGAPAIDPDALSAFTGRPPDDATTRVSDPRPLPHPGTLTDAATRVRAPQQPIEGTVAAPNRAVRTAVALVSTLFVLGAAWAVVDRMTSGPAGSGTPAAATSAPSAPSTTTQALTVDDSLPAPQDVKVSAAAAGLEVVWVPPATTDAHLVRVVVDGRPSVVDGSETSFTTARGTRDSVVCVEAVYLGVGRSACTKAAP